MDKALRLFKNPKILRSHALDEAAARESSLRSILKKFERHKEDADSVSRRALLRELDETLSELRYARACFENASDPEIVEACVYKIKSAEARYSYLLRRAKETGTMREAFKV